jgi:hypothetical protein
MPSASHPALCGVERHRALLVLLVFVNLLNPVSPFLTLAINLMAAGYFVLKKKLIVRGFEPVIPFVALLVVMWLLFIVAVRGEGEPQVVFKYLRITAAILLFSLIAVSAGKCAASITLGLNITLGFHIAIVFLQIALPDITYITAPIFGFEREPSILEQYTLRKLGASSSYDTASLFSIAALLLYYLQFRQGCGKKFFYLAALAFLATLFSSRAGIAISLGIVLWIATVTLLRASPARKAAALLFLAILVFVAYQLFLPLVLHSLGIAELDSSEVTLVFSAADYGTTGTLEALTQSHLEPLKIPIVDIFLGFSIDPNSIQRYTDIGYVKFIYHVGVPGTVLILLAHIYMLFSSIQVSRGRHTDNSVKVLAQLLALLIAIGLVFNYKSLEIYSRGYGDLLFMLFFFVTAWAHKGPNILAQKREVALT